jgi:hypothetical protein
MKNLLITSCIFSAFKKKNLKIQFHDYHFKIIKRLFKNVCKNKISNVNYFPKLNGKGFGVVGNKRFKGKGGGGSVAGA